MDIMMMKLDFQAMIYWMLNLHWTSNDISVEASGTILNKSSFFSVYSELFSIEHHLSDENPFKRLLG